MIFLQHKSLVCICGIAFLLGCERRSEQYEAEGQTAFAITAMIENYQIEHPTNQITNLSQLFAGLNKTYPHYWHEKFLHYGKYAGFSNSFFEKYIFFTSDITNSRIEGHLLVVNAKPYPSAEGRMQRSVVSRSADKVYHWKTLREEDVQCIFMEAGIVEPKPVSMLPPPPAPPEEEYRVPLSVRFSDFFAVWADQLGLGFSNGWVLQRATLGLLVVLALVSGWFTFKWIRRRRD